MKIKTFQKNETSSDLDMNCITLHSRNPYRINLPYFGSVPGEKFVSNEMYIDIEMGTGVGFKATLVMIQENGVHYLRELEYSDEEMNHLLKNLLESEDNGLDSYTKGQLATSYMIWKKTAAENS